MFAGKKVRVFLKGEAKEVYRELKKRSDKTILSSFERIKELLKENPQYGNPIRKDLIPKKIKERGIKNLYRVELAHYWRMLYTITGNEEIFVIIIHLLDHPSYDKLFSYKKK